MMERDQRQAMVRGDRARELLENDVLRTALDEIKAEVVKRWAAAPIRDAEGKEKLWQLYKTAESFESLLLGYIETGKLAADRLAALNGERPGLMKRVFNRAA